MKEKTIAFIPVRGGSKSIPLKNIRPMNGRPLVYWTIDAAIRCSRVDHVYVSTDSREIREAVIRYGEMHPTLRERLTCVDRDPAAATDTASTESAIDDFNRSHDYERLLLIQATSPLLQTRHLEEAIAKYEADGYDSMLSVVRQKRFIWREGEDGGCTSVNYDYRHRPRRQEFDGYLVENGAFYLTTRAGYEASGNRLSGRIGVYEMEESSYFEIDELSDWDIVSHLLRQNRPRHPDASGIKLFVTDIDGCMTDAGMYYSNSGDELKKFCTLDGMGISLLRQQQIKVAVITGEQTQIVIDRCRKLHVDFLFDHVRSKLEVLQKLAAEQHLSMNQIAYLGDDINDLDCIRAAGIGFCVPDAVFSVREAADVVLRRRGGAGAVREAVEYLLGTNNY